MLLLSFVVCFHHILIFCRTSQSKACLWTCHTRSGPDNDIAPRHLHGPKTAREVLRHGQRYSWQGHSLRYLTAARNARIPLSVRTPPSCSSVVTVPPVTRIMRQRVHAPISGTLPSQTNWGQSSTHYTVSFSWNNILAYRRRNIVTLLVTIFCRNAYYFKCVFLFFQWIITRNYSSLPCSLSTTAAWTDGVPRRSRWIQHPSKFQQLNNHSIPFSSPCTTWTRFCIAVMSARLPYMQCLMLFMPPLWCRPASPAVAAGCAGARAANASGSAPSGPRHLHAAGGQELGSATSRRALQVWVLRQPQRGGVSAALCWR